MLYSIRPFYAILDTIMRIAHFLTSLTLTFSITAYHILVHPLAEAAEESKKSDAPLSQASPSNEASRFGFELSSIASIKSAFVSISAEYQPPFIQELNLGVLGFGLSGSIADFIIGETSLGFGLGVMTRYQFRYFQNQLIVPMIGYQYETRTYNSRTGQNLSRLNADSIHSPFYGVWVFLNRFEPSAAKRNRMDYGIQRSYLIFEFRNNFSTDSSLSMRNYDFYFGLRLEG